jgi:alpha-amylase
MKKILLALMVCFLLQTGFTFSQTTVKKVVLQAFWWDYRNNNFPNGWANYLTELAPRLRGMGIDAVWIPPTAKANGGTNDVGYGPFDHYDLGDKFQKGNVRTRVGSKDELLRMIAVLHANGIEVIQDVVPNHAIGAGDTVSSAGIDPNAWDNKYKLFRYNCYATTVQTGTASEYRSKQGRFPKNWQNFHPNPADNCNTGNICQELFGPDVSFANGSNGQTLLSPVYDPNQLTYNPFNTSAVTGSAGNGYMRRHYREWLIWYKKQTGFDGVRMDAVKHYETAAAEDFLYNLQFGSGWANGGNGMFAVGEYVGNSSELDSWTNAVQKRAGTFDFSLRTGIKNMVDNGFFDMASLPGFQQAERIQYVAADNTYYNRSTNFVNNHDTFRPFVDTNGNYTGWDSGNELGGGHIDPFSSKMPLSYAAMMAMDGNEQLFIEDLFNIGGTSKRYTHLPASTTNLPSRAPVENIIWCHQSLGFKNGSYKVRSTAAGGNVYFSPDPDGAGCADLSRSQDLLIIERSNRAIIGLNDRSDACGWQSAWVDSDFPAGTVLKDYSGANGTATVTVAGDKRVKINVPPVNPAANTWGYAIWAPAGAATYVPNRNALTTQEWEMANDLGDSHCSSLGQGGSLPANSTRQRVAGKIFVKSGQAVSYTIYPELNGNNINMALWNNGGTKLHENSAVISSSSPLTGSYTPVSDGWLVIKVRNSVATQPTQKLFIKVSYTAPTVVNTLATANLPANTVYIWTGNKNTTDAADCGNWEEGRVPPPGSNASTPSVIIPSYALPYPVFPSGRSVYTIIQDQKTELDINGGNTFFITPNPVTSRVAIGTGVKNRGEIISAQLLNNTGVTLINYKGSLQVMEQKINNLMSSLSAGVYYIKLLSDRHSQTLKMIKQ